MPPKPKKQVIAMTGDAHRIEGLGDLARALRKIGKEYANSLRDANYELASQVVEIARQRASREPGVTEKAAQRGLRALRRGKEVMVEGGGPKAPYFFGAEFGSLRYRQFQPWRGNQFTEGSLPGYFLHPTLREDVPTLLEEYQRRLDELHREAFPDEE